MYINISTLKHVTLVLLTVEEEGLRNLWSGVTPAILRHVGTLCLFVSLLSFYYKTQPWTTIIEGFIGGDVNPQN